MRESIANATASNDSLRCGDETAITTLASFTGTVPNLLKKKGKSYVFLKQLEFVKELGVPDVSFTGDEWRY